MPKPPVQLPARRPHKPKVIFSPKVTPPRVKRKKAQKKIPRDQGSPSLWSRNFNDNTEDNYPSTVSESPTPIQLERQTPSALLNTIATTPIVPTESSPTPISSDSDAIFNPLPVPIAEIDEEDQVLSSDTQSCRNCGLIHSQETLINAMKNSPAAAKDEAGFKHSGWHSCTNLWVETTFRVSNKTFICLACTASNKYKLWCFKKHPQISTIKRHYRLVHPNEAVTKLIFPDASAGGYTSNQLNKDVLLWITSHNHPFAIVEEENLRTIFHSLNPQLKLLHRKQLVDKFLPLLVEELDNKVFYLNIANFPNYLLHFSD